MMALVLTGCDRLDAWLHPYDETAAVRTTPVPPINDVEPQLYPIDQNDVSLQLRQGDCATKPCLEFLHGHWQTLPRDQIKGVPLLALEGATGSAYSDDLWSPVGSSGDFVLLNERAAIENISRGRYDGLRIGLRDRQEGDLTTTYATAVAFSGKAPTLQLNPRNLSVVIGGNRAWLIHKRPNGAVDLIDLFAVNRAADPVICLSGLYLDITPGWAGPVDKALSPNIFESRDVDHASSDALKAKVMSCAVKASP